MLLRKSKTGGLIIDVTRCSVALAGPQDLMEAFQLLTSQESQDKFGYKIVRFKNKFEPKSKDTFKNIMVNALVRGGTGEHEVIILRFVAFVYHPQGQRSVNYYTLNTERQTSLRY